MSGGEVISNILSAVETELKRAQSLHPPMSSVHEAFAIIEEEVDELWDDVRKRSENRSREQLKSELIQIAAMAVRAVHDLNL